MKIAFSTSGTSLSSPVDSRFGRAASFLIFDVDSEDYTIIDNSQNVSAKQGAGVQAAQLVVDAGVKVVVSGHCGPKAQHVLQTANIAFYSCGDIPILDAIAQFKSGELKQVT